MAATTARSICWRSRATSASWRPRACSPATTATASTRSPGSGGAFAASAATGRSRHRLRPARSASPRRAASANRRARPRPRSPTSSATCRRSSTPTGSGSTASCRTRSGAGREALYHLVATPLANLEGQEGISIGDLSPRGLTPRGAGLLTLARDERIETRLREDDRVLVTPAERAPGELLSVEGTLRGVGAHEVTVELRDSLPPSKVGRYRIDQLPFRSPWQVQGLTDFLIGAIRGTAASGRQLRVERTAAPRAADPRRGRTGAARHRRWHPRRARPERRPAPRARRRAQPRTRRPAAAPGATRHRQDLHDRHPRPRHRRGATSSPPRTTRRIARSSSSPIRTAPPTR